MNAATKMEKDQDHRWHLWDQRITVHIKNGVVALSGDVGTYDEKIAAGKTAQSVFGTRGVANYLAVKP